MGEDNRWDEQKKQKNMHAQCDIGNMDYTHRSARLSCDQATHMTHGTVSTTAKTIQR